MMTSKNILIVDDSKATRSMAMFSLSNHGFRLLEAEDAYQALDLMQTETVDMVITDLKMPELDGVGLTQKIRSRRENDNLPIIMITAVGGEEARQRALSAGVSSYLTKPFKPQQLLDLVRSVLC